MKLLLVAGSSGGHIFPALALLEHLKADHPRIEAKLVIPRSNLSPEIGSSGYDVSYIDSAAVSSRIDSRNLLAILKFIRGSWQSLIIILKFRPDTVVGFGSIASVPLVLFAWLMRLKVILHEQNVIPGQANRFLAGFCDRIAISFEATRGYLKTNRDKAVLTGNPLRASLARIDKRKCREFFALEEDKFTILVMGGSQGSLRINRAFLKAVGALSGGEKLQVIHLSGAKEEAVLSADYSRTRTRARVFPFLKEMEYALSLADLAVCRAGATTVQELIHYRLPAVLVPYPFAYQHQMANARVLESAGAAVIVEDGELDSGKLKNELGTIINDPERLEKMRSGYGSLNSTDGVKKLAALVTDGNLGHG